MRCKMISNAGTACIAFQYIGLIPQIKNAEDAYTTPKMVSERRLDFVFCEFVGFINYRNRAGINNSTEPFGPELTAEGLAEVPAHQ